jgi:hypothetical protein
MPNAFFFEPEKEILDLPLMEHAGRVELPFSASITVPLVRSQGRLGVQFGATTGSRNPLAEMRARSIDRYTTVALAGKMAPVPGIEPG